MNLIQVKAVPEGLKDSIPSLIREFKAALSYVSFYSSDSPFVIQAVAKCHRTLQRFLQACGPLALEAGQGKALLNGADVSEIGELPKIFQDKDIRGVRFLDGFTALELTSWMKQITLPTGNPNALSEEFPHLQALPRDAQVVVLGEPILPRTVEAPPPPVPAGSPDETMRDGNFVLPMALTDPASGGPATQETLLSFVAEAWQHAQLQKKNIGASPEMANLSESFDRLFDRLLDRMEKTSHQFSDIRQWFNAPHGTFLENQVTASMVPLLEAAVQNGWMAVLFDPATEGLVGECLALWGANGREDMVEKTVGCLAERLVGDPFEKQMALAHLMDARPWARNAALLRKVLDRLNRLLAQETSPGFYQTALLLGWDLLEPALAGGGEEEALNLLSTLHFHADEENPAFPERSRIAHHWLFERSTPDLIRHLVYFAAKAARLNQYPLLGEMAAPLLMEGFLGGPATDRSGYLRIFAEMKEPLRSELSKHLAEAAGEDEVRKLMPVLRVCGMDPALSLQLSAWVSRGSRELKLDLLGLIEEVGDPGGGPALRLALFDDSEEIAALAARVIGKIRFLPGLPVLLKAAKIREKRYTRNDEFLVSTCRSLGDLGADEGVPFLEDIARKKPLLLRGRNYPLPLRLEAVQALARVNQPKVWSFLGSLMEEKNQPLQETLDRIIHEKMQTL